MSTINEISTDDIERVMRINFKAGNTVYIDGPPGCGKSSITDEYAEKQGPDYGVFEINAATVMLPDVIGYQYPMVENYTDHDGTVQSYKTAKFLYPGFLTCLRTGKPGFMFERGLLRVEEYGQGQVEVKRALSSLTLDHRIGEHRLPKFCDVVLLSNIAGERDGVTKDFDFLINRRAQYRARPSLNRWLTWSYDHGVSNMAMGYCSTYQSDVFSMEPPKEQGPRLTARSLVKADRALKEALDDGLKLTDGLMYTLVGGIIGKGHATNMITYAMLRDKIPSYSKVVADPNGCAVPDELDQQLYMVFELASKVEKKTMTDVCKYMKRMRQDLLVTFFRASCHRDKSLQSTPEFGDYARANLDLLMAVSK